MQVWMFSIEIPHPLSFLVVDTQTRQTIVPTLPALCTTNWQKPFAQLLNYGNIHRFIYTIIFFYLYRKKVKYKVVPIYANLK